MAAHSYLACTLPSCKDPACQILCRVLYESDKAFLEIAEEMKPRIYPILICASPSHNPFRGRMADKDTPVEMKELFSLPSQRNAVEKNKPFVSLCITAVDGMLKAGDNLQYIAFTAFLRITASLGDACVLSQQEEWCNEIAPLLAPLREHLPAMETLCVGRGKLNTLIYYFVANHLGDTIDFDLTKSPMDIALQISEHPYMIRFESLFRVFVFLSPARKSTWSDELREALLSCPYLHQGNRAAVLFFVGHRAKKRAHPDEEPLPAPKRVKRE